MTVGGRNTLQAHQAIKLIFFAKSAKEECRLDRERAIRTMVSPEAPQSPFDVELDNPSGVSKPFPSVFYDPTTGQLLKEPMVNISGDSYEQKQDGTGDDYPNRALKSIIESEVKLSETSLSGSLRRMDQRMWSSVGSFLESSPSMRKIVRPLPKSFYCPITQEIMTDPCIAKDGTTYERRAIRQWIEQKRSSPLTRQELTRHDIRDNNAIYELIQAAKGEDAPHESIRRWIDSGMETARRSDREGEAAEEGTLLDCILLPVYLIVLILGAIAYAVLFVVLAILMLPVACCCPGEEETAELEQQSTDAG